MAKKEITTHKKQKFVGVRDFVDVETGELYPMQIRMVEDRDFNFHKVWLQHLVNCVDGIANRKLKLAFWIIENLDSENKFIMTQRVIAQKTGIGIDTVNRTLQALCKPDESGMAFLQKINSGAYRVNPNVIYKGSHNNRMGICFQYRQTDTENKVLDDVWGNREAQKNAPSPSSTSKSAAERVGI